MRTLSSFLIAIALFLSPLLADSLLGQQQQQPERPSVQVGVPDGGPGDAPGRPAPAPAAGRGRPTRPPEAPPRSASGKILLGGKTPKDTGVWLPTGTPTNAQNIKTVPFQPWARAVLADRDIHQLEPHTRCKPSGVTRPFLTPYGVEFVELPELQRIYIFDIGGPHTYRTIYMDGRTHPERVEPSYYGHSIGWWEGDTLVVETVGFNEGFWLDRRGTPHTDALRTLERFTRTDMAVIKYEVTFDDPGAFTAKWTSGFDLRWEPGTELFEYVCQQANYAHELMVGGHESVSRTSPIIP